MARMIAGDLTPDHRGALVTAMNDDGTNLTMILNSTRVEDGEVVLAGWCVDRNVEVMLPAWDVLEIMHAGAGELISYSVERIPR